MNATPLEESVPLTAEAGGAARLHSTDMPAGAQAFRPLLGLLTLFWVYVTVSNVTYANNMQASLSLRQIEHVFAAWDARVLQHLMLYPLFILAMRGALRSGWQPWWRKLPLQLALALVFAALAAPALMAGEYLTDALHGMGSADHSSMQEEWMTWQGFVTHELPLWTASITTFLITYGFGLALVTGFAFYQRLRDAQLRTASLERALTQAHLATLRMQLSPHTLFNLLHTIRGQIAWDPPAAQAMVVQLADLLRRLLNAGERELSRLEAELKFVSLYLALQQQRFADRLTFTVPDPGTAPAAWVPSLILQPLVENAVLHGLAGHEGPVRIEVEVAVSGERLTLRVVNTSAPQRVPAVAGIGLTNVRERLAVQFGETAHFAAGEVAGGTWCAEIQMPLLRDGPERVLGEAHARQ